MDTPQLKTYCFFNVINDVLNAATEEYKLDLEESIYLKSVYFYQFYKLREQNNCTRENGILLDFIVIRDFSKECLKLFRKDYDVNVSQNYIFSQWKKNLEIHSKDEYNIEFEMDCLSLPIKNIISFNKTLDFNNKIFEDALYILHKFQADVISVELYMVLLFDISLTYLANKEIEQTINSQFMHKIITGQIKTIGKRVYTDEDDGIIYSSEPPNKMDFSYGLKLQVFDGSSSLELLVSFFGEKLWYQQFDEYKDENTHHYFRFTQEPDFLFVENKRLNQYKDIPMETGVENFLSTEYVERFFRLWEYRLFKSEKVFFNMYIKPEILNKRTEIKFNFSKFNSIDIKTILKAIRETSSFTFNGKGVFGFVTLVSTKENDKSITLCINQDLYKNVDHD